MDCCCESYPNLLLRRPAAGLAIESGKTKLKSLKEYFDEISEGIIEIHDSQATRQDVDSLYKVLSNIIKNSTNASGLLGYKGIKIVELVKDEVWQSAFMPQLSILKELACQMTCESFQESTAQETTVEILGMLEGYTWDAKAVIAMAAFGLDYGESWRFSLMQSTSQSALQVFGHGTVEKLTQSNHQLDSLVKLTLEVIGNIIELEKIIAEKNIRLKNVPDLPALNREFYTFSAIFALACASRITRLERDFVNHVGSELSMVSLELDDILRKIENYKAFMADYKWALDVIDNPSGILMLLKALIFLKNDYNLEIFDNSTKKRASLKNIKKQNLFLFISGLYDIEKEIKELKLITDMIKNDQEKQDYKILWIPVVENWNHEQKSQFGDVKSEVEWCVVQNFIPFRGLKLLREEFHYNGKPIMVVTNPRGQIIHKNAMPMILIWGKQAFPFQPEDETRLSEHWNWFWSGASKVHTDIEKWAEQGNYIVLYESSNDVSVTQSVQELIITIEKDRNINDASIEQFDLSEAKKTDVSEFWANINHLFYSGLDEAKDHIARILFEKEKKGWFLVSEGQNVLLVDSDIQRTIKGVKEKGLKDFIECYKREHLKDDRCRHFKVVDFRSRVPKNITCLNCNMEVEILFNY